MTDAEVIAWERGNASNECYLVSKGVRPVACIEVKAIAVDEVLEDVKARGLDFFHVKGDRYNTASAIYVWKHPHMEQVVRWHRGPRRSADIPSPVSTWITGKVFGYSEEEIGRFIAKQEGP